MSSSSNSLNHNVFPHCAGTIAAGRQQHRVSPRPVPANEMLLCRTPMKCSRYQPAFFMYRSLKKQELERRLVRIVTGAECQGRLLNGVM